jgi:hypothetical protein
MEVDDFIDLESGVGGGYRGNDPGRIFSQIFSEIRGLRMRAQGGVGVEGVEGEWN